MMVVWFTNAHASPALTHWGRVTHICVSKLTIIGSDNGLSPVRRQAIIWTYAGILLIRPKLQWNVNRTSNIFIHENAFDGVVCEMASILSRPQCVNSSLPRTFQMPIEKLKGIYLGRKHYNLVKMPIHIVFVLEASYWGLATHSTRRRTAAAVINCHLCFLSPDCFVPSD